MKSEHAKAVDTCNARDEAERYLRKLLVDREPFKGDPRHLIGACENLLHEWGIDTSFAPSDRERGKRIG